MCQDNCQKCCCCSCWFNLCGILCGGVLCACCCGSIWMCKDQHLTRHALYTEDDCICESYRSPGLGCNICCVGCNINPDQYVVRWSGLKKAIDQLDRQEERRKKAGSTGNVYGDIARAHGWY